MSTSIVYVLSSDDTDFFLEQLAISLFSLRKHNPDASVTVLTDKETNDTLNGNRRMILEFVNELKIVDTPPDFTKKMRSRFLKTNLRKLIDGDFLYIDLDTVICEPLAGIDNLSQTAIIHYYTNSRNCNYPLARDSTFLTVREYGLNVPFIKDLIDNPRQFLVSGGSRYFIYRYHRLNDFFKHKN